MCSGVLLLSTILCVLSIALAQITITQRGTEIVKNGEPQPPFDSPSHALDYGIFATISDISLSFSVKLTTNTTISYTIVTSTGDDRYLHSISTDPVTGTLNFLHRTTTWTLNFNCTNRGSAVVTTSIIMNGNHILQFFFVKDCIVTGCTNDSCLNGGSCVNNSCKCVPTYFQPDCSLRFWLEKEQFCPGERILISWEASADYATALDWIALYALDSHPALTDYYDYDYVNGLQVSTIIVLSGSLPWTMDTAGNYSFVYYTNDVYVQLASVNFEVLDYSTSLCYSPCRDNCSSRGVCASNNLCSCTPPFYGPECEKGCTNNTLITDVVGQISDGSGNWYDHSLVPLFSTNNMSRSYRINIFCSWIVKPNFPQIAGIKLAFRLLSVGLYEDALKVFAGTNTSDPSALVASLVCQAQHTTPPCDIKCPQTGNVAPFPIIVNTSTVTLEFVSDPWITGQGFLLDYAAYGCSPGEFIEYDALHQSYRCSACPPGTYSDVEGLFVCINCSTGQYNPLYGQSACALCPAGTYSAVEGSLYCKNCSEGTYNPYGGLASCAQCEPGSYTTSTAQINCMKCPRGTYKSEYGPGECNHCPTNAITELLGAIYESECTCDTGFYKPLHTNSCVACPIGGQCWGGDAMPTVLPGYWSDGNLDFIFLNCISQDHCSGNSSCAVGYEGTLCGDCAAGFYWSGASCHACGGGQQVIFAFCIIALFSVAVFLVVASFFSSHSQALFGIGTAFFITLNYFQLQSNYNSYSKQWPSITTDWISFTGIFNFDFNLLALDCSASLSFGAKYGLRLLLPIFYFCFTVVVWIIGQMEILLLQHLQVAGFTNFELSRLEKLKPGTVLLVTGEQATQATDNSPRNTRSVSPEITLPPSKAFMEQPLAQTLFWRVLLAPARFTWDHVICANVIFIDVTYLFLMSSAFILFDCYAQDDGTYSLVDHPSMFCFDTEWKSLLSLAIPALLFYGFGIPALVAVILWKTRKTKNPIITIRFSFLWNKYKPELYWWQLVIMARKFFMSFALVSFAKDPTSKLFGGVLVLLISMILHLIKMPYIAIRHNYLEMYLLAVNALLGVVGLVYLTPTIGSTTTGSIIGIFSVLLAVSGLFFSNFMLQRLTDWKIAVTCFVLEILFSAHLYARRRLKNSGH